MTKWLKRIDNKVLLYAVRTVRRARENFVYNGLANAIRRGTNGSGLHYKPSQLTNITSPT